jgi:hypothetical protein
MIYVARMFVGVGGTWQKGETKQDAVKKCVQRAIEDWSGLYDIKGAVKAGVVEVHIYEDGGTDSFDDDTYIETVMA